MPAINDDNLLAAAPNIQVQVATPPPFESIGFDLERIPRYLFSIVDIASKKTGVIRHDYTKYLIEKTKLKTPPSEFLIKNYGDPVVPSTVPPIIPEPPEPEIPPPGSGGPPTTTSPSPDLPDGLPFDEIVYLPKDLVPYKAIGGEEEDPGKQGFFKNFPSAVYIDAISSCISTPFVSPRFTRSYNGVLGDSRTNSYYATYFWQCDAKSGAPELTPRPDGIVQLTAQDKSAKKPLDPIYLDPGKWEKRLSIYNGDALNSFAMILGITPGGGDEQPKDSPWSIKMEFGDITFEYFEGKSEATVSIKGMDPPKKVMIRPTSASHLTEKFGPRVIYVTFIPVWNGILISDGIPGSSDWANSVTFVAKDKSLDINKEINNIINPPPPPSPPPPPPGPDGEPIAGEDLGDDMFDDGGGVGITDDDFLPHPPLPPKTIVQRKGEDGKKLKKFLAPGIRISRGYNQISFGTRLKLTFHRCGGSFKFVPIYFPPFSRYHLLAKGSVNEDDLQEENPPVPLNPNVFDIPSESNAIPMPIFSYETAQYLDFRINIATIVKDKVKPWSCMSMEFQARTPDIRRPMQVWGALIMDESTFTVGSVEKPPPNADGVISINAISPHRIKSFNISRQLDGASGEIIWDRFNPLTGQVDPRPIQEVGGIEISVTGGANTVEGIAFTGIAYGNSEEDNPGENLIRIPIKGRESKLTSEGGLALVMVPFFDGYDHRDAMLYMANYAGFPIDISKTEPFRLISSYNIQNPVLDFPSGTAVAQAMDTISTAAGALYYFDRLGTLIYMSVERPTGVNWSYPDLILESFSDEPDSTWVRNQILIFALVADESAQQTINVDYTTVETQMVLLRIPLVTYPKFEWAKMGVYTIPQIVRDMEEVTRQAIQIAKGQSRPRATARCKIPGNARIELLDTINERWAVTSISQQVDIQRKTWSTDIGVEMIRPDLNIDEGDIEKLPLTDKQ